MSTLSDWWNNSWLGQAVQGLSDTWFGTTYGQQRLQENQAEINDYLSGKQRGWEEYMWNKSNAYNSPQAQMQRLRDAGLNPSLVYGQPISEAGVPAGAEGSVGLGSAQHGSLSPQGIYQLDLLQSQRELLDAQRDEIRSRIPLNEQKISKLIQDIDESQSRVNLNLSRIANLDEDTRRKIHETAISDLEEQFQSSTYNRRLAMYEADATEKSIAAEYARTLMESRIRGLDAKSALDEVRAKWHDKLSQSQINMLDELAELYHQKHLTDKDYRDFFDAHKEQDRFLRIMFSAIDAGNDAIGNAIEGAGTFSTKKVKVVK